MAAGVRRRARARPPLRIALPLPPAPPLEYDAVVMTAPRAGGAATLCATLASLAQHAKPRKVAVSFGRAAGLELDALLAACPGAAHADAVFALPHDAPRAGVLESYVAALRGGVLLSARDVNASRPLLVLEDDVLLSPLFEPALSAAAAALRLHGVPRFMLSLYNGVMPPLADAAARAAAVAARRRRYCSPRALRFCASMHPQLGAGVLRDNWGWGTQALLFSHPADVAAYFVQRTQAAPTHDGGSGFVGLQDMLLRELVYEPAAAVLLRHVPRPAVYGLDVSLVQHVGAASTLFGNSSASNTRFHQAPDFLGVGEADVGSLPPPALHAFAGAAATVEAPPWPSVWSEPRRCAAELVTPCCAGPSGFRPPGGPMRARELAAALRAAPDADAPLFFRITAVPCARAGCCTASLALRPRRAGGAADVDEVERLLSRRAPMIIPALARATAHRPPPASVLHAGARAGHAAVLMAHLWPGARIVALEADASAATALDRVASELPNVTAVHAALHGGGNATGGVRVSELVSAHLPQSSYGFDFVWLDVDAAALRAALDAADWLPAARIVALQLRGVPLRDARESLPRTEWAHAAAAGPARALHIFTRRRL